MPWLRATKLAEIPPGTARAFDLKGESVLVVHASPGRVHALENRCSHDGADMDGCTIVDGALQCPRHGARFDPRNGAVLRAPAVVPMPTFECRIVDNIWVEVEVEP